MRSYCLSSQIRMSSGTTLENSKNDFQIHNTAVFRENNALFISARSLKRTVITIVS